MFRFSIRQLMLLTLLVAVLTQLWRQDPLASMAASVAEWFSSTPEPQARQALGDLGPFAGERDPKYIGP